VLLTLFATIAFSQSFHQYYKTLSTINVLTSGLIISNFLHSFSDGDSTGVELFQIV